MSDDKNYGREWAIPGERTFTEEEIANERKAMADPDVKMSATPNPAARQRPTDAVPVMTKARELPEGFTEPLSIDDALKVLVTHGLLNQHMWNEPSFGPYLNLVDAAILRLVYDYRSLTASGALRTTDPQTEVAVPIEEWKKNRKSVAAIHDLTLGNVSTSASDALMEIYAITSGVLTRWLADGNEEGG